MSEMMGGDVGALAEALAAAQGEMESAKKDGANPHFKSTFATLASVWSAIRGPFAAHGLSVTQHPSTDGNVVTVRTMLMHKGGGWLASDCSAVARDSAPQSIGSAISYLRRYALAAVCGVAQEDDDGEGATDRDKKPVAQRQERPAKRQTKPEVVQDEPAAPESLLNEIAERMMEPAISDEERGKLRKWMERGTPTETVALRALEELNRRIADHADTLEAA